MTVVVNVGKMFYFKRAMLTQDCVLYLGKLPFFCAAPVEFPFHYTLSLVSLFSDLSPPSSYPSNFPACLSLTACIFSL